jgi:hypothetical protein
MTATITAMMLKVLEVSRTRNSHKYQSFRWQLFSPVEALASPNLPFCPRLGAEAAGVVKIKNKVHDGGVGGLFSTQLRG